jgi:hypothetical protein
MVPRASRRVRAPYLSLVEPPIEIPRVSPVGLLDRPAGFASAPRRYSPVRRAFAAAVLALVTLVTVLTTVASLGSYCLTTEPGDVRSLPAGR